MSIKEVIKKMKSIQNSLLEFLEDETNNEENYENVKKFLTEQKMTKGKQELKSVLRLITHIGSNHRRTHNFMKKVEQIYSGLKNSITKHFSNSEIFNIFGSNKRILLYAVKDQLVKIDEHIFTQITTKDEYIKAKYPQYFAPEIKKFLTAKFIKKHHKKEGSEWIAYVTKKISDDFEKKRLEGENDDFLCELIRKGNSKEFVIYVSKTGLSLHSYIKESIFETNPAFFNDGRTKIIEYASFFGSNEIIHYLVSNEVKLMPNMWIYAMHSNSDELIHYLEDQGIAPEREQCEEILRESIKCHHNDEAMFVINNLIKDEDLTYNEENNFYENLYRYSVEYYNYNFFPKDRKNKYMFFYLCEFGYYTLVNFYLTTEYISINETIVCILIL